MTNRDSTINIENEDIEDWNHDTIQKYHTIQTVANACDYTNVKELEKISLKFPYLAKMLQYHNTNRRKTQESWSELKRNVLEKLLTDACRQHPDDNERLFFYAAQLETDKLKQTIHNLRENQENFNVTINQTRNTDSVLVFCLKYCDPSKDSFQECVKTLIDAGIDTNKFDNKGKTPIDYVTLFYNKYKNNSSARRNLEEVARLLVARKIYREIDDRTKNALQDMNIHLDEVSGYTSMDTNSKLFYLIIKNNHKDFCNISTITDFLKSDNGEHTLLQFASKIFDNRLQIVQFLLRKGAEPNICTEWDKRTPLELAALNNNQKIFTELLNHKKTKIKEQQFNNLIRSCRPKLTQLLLESSKLDPLLTYEKTGNTPLHYSILYSYQKATQGLLRRGASLITKNEDGKSVLDMIHSNDLEHFYNSCLILDHYASSLLSMKYKMQFNFYRSIFDPEVNDELYIVYKMSKKRSLSHLLKHPLVNAFMILKWYRMKIYFHIVLLFQAFLFFVMGFVLYVSPEEISPEECIFFTINAFIKLPVIFNFKMKDNWPIFFVLKQAKAHASVEIILILTHILGFVDVHNRAFIFTEMAVCFLLTAGYHPKLSKWSLMLQRVFKTFTMLLIFFSLVLLTFSLGFHLLFYKDEDDHMFQNFFTSVFKTYIMTTGELNADDIDFKTSGTSGYILLLIFTLSMSLVIVNFWTGVAVTDIEKIERHSKVKACKNVLVFMKFIDYIYSSDHFRVFRRFLPQPFLFLHLDQETCVYENGKKCRVDFYINKTTKQFGEEAAFPLKLDDECVDKIKLYCDQTHQKSNEQDLKSKLGEVLKTEQEILFRLKQMEEVMKVVDGAKKFGTPKSSLKKQKSN